MAKPVERVEVDAEELASILERSKSGPLSEDEYRTLKAALDTLIYLTDSLENQSASLKKLRELLFGATSEKTKDVLEQARAASGSGTPSGASGSASAPPTPPPGHGRRGAQEYTGAERVAVAHPSLKPKDPCPACPKGKVYPLPPAQVVRVRGQAPVGAVVYELGRLRCNLCGKIFTAPEPAGTKYDASAGSMVALLKYGSGVPFHRLETLQAGLETPLPASTQWDIVRDLAQDLEPLHRELIAQAAEGEVLHNDDTGMTILAQMKENREQEARGTPRERTGTFTSGIVSTAAGRRIALFFTGRSHAGENLAAVLAARKSPQTPMQMCDGLSRNLPKEMQTIVGNCMAHARRQFVELVDVFPDEVRHLLTEIGLVYRNEAEAKAARLSAEERLRFHQERSRPVLEALERWMRGLLDQKRVEPNASLGKALSYMLKRWDALTLFLRKPGAPLDNNVCEQALKKAILNRKNAYFYKTENGARVGDLFMSLIATCQLAQVNPFAYLTALQLHRNQAREKPSDWMPWNYPAAMLPEQST